MIKVRPAANTPTPTTQGTRVLVDLVGIVGRWDFISRGA